MGQPRGVMSLAPSSTLDSAEENIEAARRHAEAQGLPINYRTGSAEDLVAESASYDALVCLEVLEHVPNPRAFLTTCASLLHPGGAMILSTINRTLKAYALAIVGAEYILRWLPAGTHQWERFITPDELARDLTRVGLAPLEFRGLVYN